ncbi:MAG: hypothetical protein OXC05_15925 [Halieaceae bacterium]|nr:hypothetical protein [Halieaceae bacterium]
MTSRLLPYCGKAVLTGVVLCAVALAACTPEVASDYCRNHHEIHAQHQDPPGTLSVTMTEQGLLKSELVLPVALFAGADPRSMLEAVENVYSLQTEKDCREPQVSVAISGEQVSAAYLSDCGPENKIGQLDIALFDALPRLDEVVVTVTTPVAQKHFAISRQCESAIFRLARI